MADAHELAEHLEAHESSLVAVTLTLGDDWKSEPIAVLRGIREGARNLDRWQRRAVRLARDQGHTWDEIGKACGVSRQAAWERFGSD